MASERDNLVQTRRDLTILMQQRNYSEAEKRDIQSRIDTINDRLRELGVK